MIRVTGWWFQTFLFSIIYGTTLPIDFHIFQDGYCTTNQVNLIGYFGIKYPSTISYTLRNPGLVLDL